MKIHKNRKNAFWKKKRKEITSKVEEIEIGVHEIHNI